MATGTTADFTVTRNELIDLALGSIGVSEPGNSDYDLSVKVLNMLVRHLDARGEWIWGMDNTESTLTLVASQAEYTTGAAATDIATDILKLEYCALVDGTDDRTVLKILDKKSALRTPLKDDSDAEPIAVHLERAALRSNNKMVFYPTPDTAESVVYHYRKPLFDFDLSTDNPDFPQDFFLPLKKMLASELAPHYGIPLNERQILEAIAEKAFKESEATQGDGPAYIPLKTEYF